MRQRDRVVHGRALPAVALGVEAAVEAMQVRHQPPRAARGGEPLGVGVVSSARCVTSRPTIVTGRPLSKTRRAASGSHQMLNSAAGVTLPRPIAPPISTIRLTLDAGRGWRASSSATFVSGPVATSVTGSGSRSIACAIQSIACSGSASRAAGGRSGPSRPLSPCTCCAFAGSRISGRSAPAATASSGCPTWSRMRIALAVVFWRVWLPATVVTPSRRISGEASASSSAIASSWPGSQSRITGVGTGRVSHPRDAPHDVLGAAVGGSSFSTPSRAGFGGAPRARAAEGRVVLTTLQQRDHQRGTERVAGGGSVHGLDAGRGGAGELAAVLEQDRALGAEREREQPAVFAEGLALVCVDDDEVGVGRQRAIRALPARGRGVEAEVGRLGRGRGDRGVGDLQLADHRVDVPDRDVLRAQPAVGAGGDDDRVLAAALLDDDQRDAALALVAHHARGVDAVALQRAQHELVGADAPDEAHPRAEPRGGEGLVGALAASDAFELGVGDGLAGARQALAARDEVNVRGAHDGDAGGDRHAGHSDTAAEAARIGCSAVVDLRIERSAQDVAQAAAQLLISDLGDAVERYGTATWVAAGGNTAGLAFEALARFADAVAWDRVRVLMGDERCVAPDHPDSNWRQLEQQLLSRVAIPRHNLLRPPAELGGELGAERYEAMLRELEPAAGGAPRLDHVWLGMGEDGHTLSLFPGHPALEADGLVVPVHDSPKPPPNRISLSFAALGGARTCAILTAGAGKREALARALSGDVSLPVARAAQLVEGAGGRAIWLVNEAAAADLG